MKVNKVKVILIGFGHLGKWHAEKAVNLENSELIAIIDKSKEHQQIARDKFPAVPVLDSYDDILEDFEAALIVTPTSSHFSIAKDLIKKGKHIFCEKPLCSKTAEASELRDLGREHNCLIQVGHSERFHKAWEKLKVKIQSLKSPLAIEFRRESSFKGRAIDVDVIQDLAIHDIDLFYYLFEKEVSEITSVKHFKALSNFPDYTDVNFKTTDNDYVRIISSRQSAIGQRSLKITHPDGEIYIDLMNLKYFIYEEGNLEEVEYERRDHLLEEQKCFYHSILNNTATIVGAEDGLKAVKLMDELLQLV